MRQRQRQILCIDDDAQSLRVRTILFESMGYKVLCESDAQRGLRSFRRCDVDAVLMDYQMPGMSGGEAAVEMKRLRPDVPVVIMSALPSLPEDAPRHAIDGFVQKGEPLAVVAGRLERLIADHENSVETRRIGAQQFGVALGYLLGSLAGAMRKKVAVH